MFGGAGLYHSGLMFGLISEDVAYLKVDDSNRPDFVAAGSKPFRPYRKKGPVLSYYQVPGDVLEDAAAFGDWARKAFTAASRAKRK
jgi:DNA transformation protein